MGNQLLKYDAHKDCMSVSGGHVNQTLSVFLKVVTLAHPKKKCPQKKKDHKRSKHYLLIK